MLTDAAPSTVLAPAASSTMLTNARQMLPPPQSLQWLRWRLCRKVEMACALALIGGVTLSSNSFGSLCKGELGTPLLAFLYSESSQEAFSAKHSSGDVSTPLSAMKPRGLRVCVLLCHVATIIGSLDIAEGEAKKFTIARVAIRTQCDRHNAMNKKRRFCATGTKWCASSDMQRIVENFGYEGRGIFSGVPLKRICEKAANQTTVRGLCDNCVLEEKGTCYPELTDDKYFWGKILKDRASKTPPKHEDRTTRAMEAMCRGQCWAGDVMQCCCFDGEYVPFTARVGFRVTVATKMTRFISKLQKLRAMLCNEKVPVGLGERWGSVGKAVSSVKSAVKAGASNMAAKVLRKMVVSELGDENLNFICSATDSALSIKHPTVTYLKKRSAAHGSEGMNHGKYKAAPQVLWARKLVPTAYCPECKAATKDSDHETWMPSTKAGRGSILCEAVMKIQLVRCSTCCCRGGLIKSSVGATLTYKAPGQRGMICGAWFAAADVFIRVMLLGMRILQNAMYIAPTCFQSKLTNSSGNAGRGPTQLALAKKKCN